MHKTITLFGKAAPLFFFLLLTGISSKSYAQCAGEDASTTSCDKETNQFIDLFAALNGSPVTGGTWSDDNNSGGLNGTTGELNTWLINRGGTFNYTYTVEDIADCTDNQATVTVTLAGYAGRDNNDGVACETENDVNLFQFVGSSPSPTLFGTWAITVGPANALNGQIFNAQQAGPGNYTFTYTVASQGSCPSTMSTVMVEVIEAPDSGSIDNTVNTVFCETDDLSGFTTFNLRDAIIGEDNGGVWTENQTNEINGFNDSTIDIQNIRDTFGPGTYTFTYTVQPVNPICTFSQTTVAIIIEEVVDFTNAALELTTPDEDIFCEDILPIDAVATITGDIADIPNGNYELTYNVSPAPNTGTDTVTLSMTEGVGRFNINPDFFTAAGVATIRVVSIIDPNTQNACDVKLDDLSDTLTIVALPDVSDSALSVKQPLCFGEDGTLTISDAGNTSEIELADGEYTFSYTLASSTATQDYDAENVTVTDGIAEIPLLANDLATSDDYIITLNAIENSTGCSTTAAITTTFTVSPKPDARTLTVSILDTCEDDTVTVTITDSSDTPNLVDGTYNFTYDISGSITATNQPADDVTITDGTGSFDLPQAILANGNSTLTLTAVSNTASTCEADNLANPTASFNIIATPDATGAVVSIDDSCEDAANTVTITTDPTLIQDGDYILVYNLSDANPSAEDTDVEVTFTGGKTTFDLTATQLAEAGTTTITIISLATASQRCAATGLPIATTFEVLPVPSLENTTLSVASVCFGESTELLFTNSDLSDGNYDINYELIGENTFSDNASIEFIAGEASLTIAAETITNTGSTTITINSIADPGSSCANTTATSTSFEVNPVPELADGDLLASDICLAKNGFVTITAGANLADGDYIITYNLSVSNTAQDLTADVEITNGQGSFEIPAINLSATGTTTITATLINSDAGCSSVPVTVNDDFEIFPLPDATGITGTANDVCFGEPVTVRLSGATVLSDIDYEIYYQLSGATESEIITETVKFTGGSADVILESSVFNSGGLTMFNLLDIQNSTTECSATNLPVTVVDFTLENPAVPSITSDGAVFCINDDPTVADLEANISSSFTIITYDSATGTSVVSPSTPLRANTTYYITAQNTATGCEGSQRLEVTVDLSGCDSVFIPDGFSPNGDGINDLFEMKNMEIVYPDYTIEIFNRYGQVVFKGDSSTGFWDGHANQNRLGGNTLANGVYFYIINYNDGQTSPKQGKVYLNR